MPDLATTLIQKARDAGLIDERAAQSILDLHRHQQTSDLADAPEAARQATDRFGKFVLVEKLGEGGMGAVWKAWQTDLGRWVALKFVKGDNPEDVARFIREAQTAAKLSHPNIVSTHEAGEQEGKHFISMDYIEGDDLKKRRVDVPAALALIRDAAEAVHYAHRQGIVHRDLKPANLMLDADGRVRVMDFGLAKSEAAPGLSMTGTVVGTPYYMPPEQARGMPTDARSDVYALGATLYELATGHPPFEGKELMNVLRAVAEEDPTPPRRLNPKLDRDVETIVLRAMEKEPSKRYQSAKELAEELARELRGEPIVARPLSGTGRAIKWSKRNPAWAALLALVTLGAIAAASWAVAREVNRRGAIAGAEEAIGAQDWKRAGEEASAGLARSPDDRRLQELSRTAEAGKQFESARKKREEWRGKTERELPKFEADEKSLAAKTPDSAPPSKKEELWSVRKNLRYAKRDAEVARETSVQFGLAALEFDREFAPARALVTEISFHEFEKAEQDRNLDRMAIMEGAVRRYGGAEYEAKLSAPGTVDVEVTPAGAQAYLFRYEEYKIRLVPTPCSGKGEIRTVEWPSVDPLPIDAAEEAKRKAREGTAYELHADDFNRVTLPLKLPAGSYLVLFKREGYDDLRVPVLVRRGGSVEAKLAMDPKGEVPAGFVRIAAGRAIVGRDPEAQDLAGEPRKDFEPTLDDYCLQRFPVTCAEYLEFLNDRDEQTADQALTKAPRTAPTSGQYWEKDGERIVTASRLNDPSWPVLGISWNDAVAYAAWLTKKHGEGKWKFELPSEDEWEKAARGVDGRFFPYGDEFEAGFSAMLSSREAPEGKRRPPEPCGLFPADESPYGVRDLAGGMRNWTKTQTQGGLWRIVKGGSWGSQAAWCRSASRFGIGPTVVSINYGIRLAARRVSEDF